LFWIGQLVSWSGTWLQTTAQAWLVLQLTTSPLALGLVTTFQFLPFMLLSLFGGVIADRFPKHRLITATQAASLLQALVFGALIATNTIQLWHVYLLAVVQGTINALDNPTRQAFAVELVGKDFLVNAVALNAMQFNAARVLGPAIAGVLIAQIGIAPAMFIRAASGAFAVVTLLMLRPAEFVEVAHAPRGRVLTQLREGVRYAWRTPAVLGVLMIVAVIGTFGYNFNVILPLLAGFVLNTDATGFGIISAAMGIGSLGGAVFNAYTRRVTLPRLLISSACFSLLLAAVAVTPFFWLSSLLLVALGFAGVTFATAANTLIQLTVSDELRGRVMSLHVMLFIGSTPIGAFVIGALSDTASVPVALLVCAVLCALGVAGAGMYQRQKGTGNRE
jgi:MFS family permease